MKMMLSIIKADIGSIGGHICPSQRLLETVKSYVTKHGQGLLIDSYVDPSPHASGFIRGKFL